MRGLVTWSRWRLIVSSSGEAALPLPLPSEHSLLGVDCIMHGVACCLHSVDCLAWCECYLKDQSGIWARQLGRGSGGMPRDLLVRRGVTERSPHALATQKQSHHAKSHPG